MKISEFIEYLTQIQEEHGDLDVSIWCRDYDGAVEEFPMSFDSDHNVLYGTDNQAKELTLDLY